MAIARSTLLVLLCVSCVRGDQCKTMCHPKVHIHGKSREKHSVRTGNQLSQEHEEVFDVHDPVCIPNPTFIGTQSRAVESQHGGQPIKIDQNVALVLSEICERCAVYPTLEDDSGKDSRGFVRNNGKVKLEGHLHHHEGMGCFDVAPRQKWSEGPCDGKTLNKKLNAYVEKLAKKKPSNMSKTMIKYAIHALKKEELTEEELKCFWVVEDKNQKDGWTYRWNQAPVKEQKRKFQKGKFQKVQKSEVEEFLSDDSSEVPNESNQ